MRKILLFMLLILFGSTIILSSCYTVWVSAPSGKKVEIAKVKSSEMQLVSKKVWYLLWGLVNISDNTSEELLEDAKTAYIEVKQTFVDGLIGYITLGIVSPLTIEAYIK